MAEDMIYGHKAGCKFLTGKCMENGVTEWPKMFCGEPKPDGKTEVCTTDRLGLGNCALNEDNDPALPEYFQYCTSDKKGGHDFLTDYCPVVEQLNDKGCAYVMEQGKMPGNIFGKNSMCLDGDALHVKVTSGSFSVAAVCAEISCVGGSVKVKYDGDKTNKWHDCPEGQSPTPSSTSESFESGTIKCPKYKEVCTVAPDGSSLVQKVVEEPATNAPQDPNASQKPTGQPNDPKSGGKLKDSSSVPFGFIPSVAFLVLSFAGYLIA